MMSKKFKKDGRTQVYLKWMADSRDELAAGVNMSYFFLREQRITDSMAKSTSTFFQPNNSSSSHVYGSNGSCSSSYPYSYPYSHSHSYPELEQLLIYHQHQ